MEASNSCHSLADIKQEILLTDRKQEAMHPEAHSFIDTGTELASSQILSVKEQEENKENKNMNKETSEQSQRDASGNSNDADDSPVIDIIINNVVSTFNLRCHINLKRLAMEGANVEYRREHGILNMKLRQPKVTSNITSSGKVTVTGSTSEAEAKVAARRVARRLQKLGFNVRFFNFRIVNVLATCSLPFGIKLNTFSNEYPQQASYEPELHPGVTFRIKDPKATLKIFSTGSITITAPCVNNIGLAVEHIYPLVSEFQMEKREPSVPKPGARQYKQSFHSQAAAALNGFTQPGLNLDEDLEDSEECDELDDSDLNDDSFDSDVSHD